MREPEIKMVNKAVGHEWPENPVEPCSAVAEPGQPDEALCGPEAAQTQAGRAYSPTQHLRDEVEAWAMLAQRRVEEVKPYSGNGEDKPPVFYRHIREGVLERLDRARHALDELDAAQRRLEQVEATQKRMKQAAGVDDGIPEANWTSAPAKPLNPRMVSGPVIGSPSSLMDAYPYPLDMGQFDPAKWSLKP